MEEGQLDQVKITNNSSNSNQEDNHVMLINKELKSQQHT